MKCKRTAHLKQKFIDGKEIPLEYEIFFEEKLAEGLQICSSPVQLINNFQISGYKLKILHQEDSVILDPWKITVVELSNEKLKNKIDLISNINTKTDTFEAILPVFPDNKLSEFFLNSNFFYYLMTVNILKTEEFLHVDAYLVLLSKTYFFSFENDNFSKEKNEIIKLRNLLLSSVGCTYGESRIFKKYYNKFLENPKICFVKDNCEHKIKCEDIEKPVFTLAFAIYSKKIVIDSNKFLELFDLIFYESIGRNFFNEKKKNKFENFFNLEFQENFFLEKNFENFVKNIKENLNENTFKNFFNLKEIKEKFFLCINENFPEYFKNVKISMKEFNEQSFKKLKVLEKIYFDFTQKNYNTENYPFFLYFSFNNNTSFKRSKNPCLFTEEIKQEYEKKLKKKIFFKKEIMNIDKILSIWLEIKGNFIKAFSENHKEILPMEFLAFKELKKENNKLKFSKDSNLIKNACMSKHCIFYLKVRENMKSHFKLNNNLIPAFHKTVKNLFQNESDYIWDKIIAGKSIIKHIKIKFNISEEIKAKRENFLKIINELSEFYKSNKEEKIILSDDENRYGNRNFSRGSKVRGKSLRGGRNSRRGNYSGRRGSRGGRIK